MLSGVPDRKPLELLDGPLLMLRCRVGISRRHLNIGVAGEFARGWKIYAGHRHTRQGGVAKVVKAEGVFNPRSAQGANMRFADAANGQRRIPGQGEEPF